MVLSKCSNCRLIAPTYLRNPVPGHRIIQITIPECSLKIGELVHEDPQYFPLISIILCFNHFERFKQHFSASGFNFNIRVLLRYDDADKSCRPGFNLLQNPSSSLFRAKSSLSIRFCCTLLSNSYH